MFRKEDEIAVERMEPILETDDPEGLAKVLGWVSIVTGVMSVFFLGLILGPIAILTGFMAMVRKEKKGRWGLGLGALGIVTTIFWILINGEIVWFF